MFEKNWHVVYTRPGKEKRVARLLAQKKITSYLPLYKSECIVDGRKTMQVRPLFPRYVFVSTEDNRMDLLTQSRDIVNLVYWRDKPVSVQHDEISAMKLFLNEYSCTRLDKTEVMPDEHYRINNELQLFRKEKTLEANIATVKLTLPSLGHVLVAEVRKDKVVEFTYARDSMIRSISGS